MKLFSFFFILLGTSSAWANDLLPKKISCFDGAEQVPAQLVNPKSYYSESPMMRDGILYHVEFSQDRVVRVQNDRVEVLWKRLGCGPAAVTSYRDGFLVACYSSHQLVMISLSGQTKQIWASPAEANPPMSPNDLVNDGLGGLYFTSSGEFNASPSVPIEGRIYYLDATGKISEVASKIHYSNGIALSSSGDSLLVSEHLENRILKFSVLGAGRLSGKSEVFADLNALFPWKSERPSAYLGPDGFRLSGGVIFVAQYAGSRILKLNEAGQRLGMIEIKSDFPNTTNVWVEGNQLYFTAVRDDSEKGAEAVYPSIVGRLDDPKLRNRTHLVCEIK